MSKLLNPLQLQQEETLVLNCMTCMRFRTINQALAGFSVTVVPLHVQATVAEALGSSELAHRAQVHPRLDAHIKEMLAHRQRALTERRTRR